MILDMTTIVALAINSVIQAGASVLTARYVVKMAERIEKNGKVKPQK